MFEELLLDNASYAAHFLLQDTPARAEKGFGLVTCIDSRIEPLSMLGLRPGDAKILRNAGGRVTEDTLRSLVLATSLLGVTHIAVMHHTDCALSCADAELRAKLTPGQTVLATDWDFLALPDADAALHSDVSAIRSCPVLPSAVAVEGWRYDVRTGLVSRVLRS